MEFTLRKWRDSDLESLVTQADNRNISRFLTDGFPHPYTRQDGADFLKSLQGVEPVRIFAIDIGGKAVGSIGIFPQEGIHRRNAETGYWLAEPYWGRGIMSRAIREITEYGFRTFDIDRIFARPFGNNPRSHRVLEKAGFRLEARLENVLFKEGEYLDEWIYGLRREKGMPVCGKG